MLGCPSPASATLPQTPRHLAAPGHLETPRGPSRLMSSQCPTARSVCGGVRQEEHALTSREVSLSCRTTRTCAMRRHRVSAHRRLQSKRVQCMVSA
jgi:hypothetical protein